MAKIKITQRKSGIGYPGDQKATLKALGLGKMNKSRIHNDTPDILGMINKIQHLLEVEKLANGGE